MEKYLQLAKRLDEHAEGFCNGKDFSAEECGQMVADMRSAASLAMAFAVLVNHCIEAGSLGQLEYSFMKKQHDGNPLRD